MAISIVPGAVSVMGLIVSMLAVVVSLFSVKRNGRKYFLVTTSLAVIGAFLVNDGLRVWNPLPLPLNIKISLYGALILVLAVCWFAASKLDAAQGAPDKSNNPNNPEGPSA
jgi:hypothetical protein